MTRRTTRLPTPGDAECAHVAALMRAGLTAAQASEALYGSYVAPAGEWGAGRGETAGETRTTQTRKEAA